MIGAGVFTTSGLALSQLASAPQVMLAWGIGGVVALSGALSYGGLVQRIRESGGEYVFLSRVVHPMAGFMAGWVSLLAGFTGACAFAALAFENYAMPLTGVQLPAGTLAITVIALAAVLHWAGLRAGVYAQNTLVILKLLLILGFIAFGLAADLSDPAPTSDARVADVSVGAFATTLVWISLSYSGFNAAVYVAAEAKHTRTAARSLWLGTVAVFVIYLLLNFVFIMVPPNEAVAGRVDVAAAAAVAIGGAAAGNWIRVIICLALLTSVFSMVMAGPRVYARMADDGLFPAFLRFRGEIPRWAIAFQAGLAGTVTLISDVQQLLSYLGLTLSLSAAATVSALIILRQRDGPREVPVPLYPLPPILFIVATLCFASLAAWQQPVELLAAVLTLGSGALIYHLLK